MKNRLTSLLVSTCLMAGALLATVAHAADKDIQQAIQTLAPGAKVKQISKTSMPGIMEVTLDGEQGPMVVYADDKGSYLMVGDLLEVGSRRNLTRERMDKLTAIKWESLPLENAIKVVRGNGKRKLAVFSDPDCPYCRKAEQEFAKMDDVTVYVFMYPLPMHTDAGRKSKLVWCSKDRAQAWLDLMLKGKVPDGKVTCNNPVDENLALGARLKVEGTPFIIFSNGKRLPSYAPAERLEGMLNAAESAR